MSSKQSVCSKWLSQNHHRLLHRVQSVNIINPEQPSAVVLDTSGRRVETLSSPSVVRANNSEKEIEQVETSPRNCLSKTEYRASDC